MRPNEPKNESSTRHPFNKSICKIFCHNIMDYRNIKIIIIKKNFKSIQKCHKFH